jgi:hypothetical protein
MLKAGSYPALSIIASVGHRHLLALPPRLGQHGALVWIKALQMVHLVIDRKLGHTDGKVVILLGDAHGEFVILWMVQKLSVEHVNVGPVSTKAVSRRVDAHKATTSSDKTQQAFLALGCEVIHKASGVEHHSVVLTIGQADKSVEV